MTNKELTRMALQELVRKYRNPKGENFFITSSCSLCKIHYFEYNIANFASCRGCPLADADGKAGCVDFSSFQKAQSEYRCNKIGDAFEARAQFHEKVITIIEKWPESRFTPEGWTYSGEEIPREW